MGKERRMTKKRLEILTVVAIIVLQTVVYSCVASMKGYLHMDEAFSLGLANYDKLGIQDEADFYENWHTGDYYSDYLAVQDDDTFSLAQVYENQKNDVHPPLYYVLLRTVMEFDSPDVAMYSGVILNIVILAFETLLLYLVLRYLFRGATHYKKKAAVLTLVSMLTFSTMSSMLYIRMYATVSFLIMLTAYLHLRIKECDGKSLPLNIIVGAVALIGSLTHYYYLFFLVGIYLVTAIRFIIKKQYRPLIIYTSCMIGAGILSLLIFPHSIRHMFFGYRGEGFISKLLNVGKLFKGFKEYIDLTCVWIYHSSLTVLILYTVALRIYAFIRKIDVKIKERGNFLLVLVPMLVYFFFVSVASPYRDLRYIMPLSALLFAVPVFYSYELTEKVLGIKLSSVFVSALALCMVISPIVTEREPQELWSDHKAFVKSMENELNLPLLYFHRPENDRFLDDILIFTKLDNSYVTNDSSFDHDLIREIFKEQDTSGGVLIILSEDEDRVYAREQVKAALGKENSKLIKALNANYLYLIY